MTVAKTQTAKKTTAKKSAAPVKAAKSTEATKHVVKAGGKKGDAIVALLKSEPALTRTQLAEKVGATVGRVGEVVRWLAANGTADEKKVIANHVAAQPARKVAAKKATPTKAAAPAKTAAKTRKPLTPSRSRKPAEQPQD